VSWPNHGRPVQYDFSGGNPVEQLLISNPNRVNLGRIGLAFMDDAGMILNVTESDIDNTTQILDQENGNENIIEFKNYNLGARELSFGS